MSDLPTLREELDRKSMETVDYLFSNLDNGKITMSQFSTGLDVLFMATAGLVDKGIVDLVTNGAEYVRQAPDDMIIKRVFIKDSITVRLARRPGADCFTVDFYKNGTHARQELKDYVLAKQASDAMTAYAVKLRGAGFTEL